MQKDRKQSLVEKAQRVTILDSGIAKPAVKVVGPLVHMRVHKKTLLANEISFAYYSAPRELIFCDFEVPNSGKKRGLVV